MRESKIENAVCKYAKDKGWLVYKFSSPGNNGVPDRIFIKNKILYFIEFKATSKKMRKLQARIAEKIKKEKFHVFEVSTIERGIYIIDKFEWRMKNEN